ncbi:ATP-binding protein [Amycolatopsis pigmentata]|uniref:ATP-binding protein n=1 Tax=Amycolatopsis pigmentata TaxID=450801 RepID=A0ABW5FN25_9PSEU
MADGSGGHNEISGFVLGNVLQSHRVMLSRPVTPPVAVAGLPPQAVFVGRENELASVAAALRPGEPGDPAVVISTLSGLAGVGKTALAVRAAHQAVEAGWFPGGAVMMNLRGYDPGERVMASSALASLLGALGVSGEHVPPHPADRERLWRSILAEWGRRGKRLLIVADNVSDGAQVRPLLPGTREHRVLVTSRHRLADLDGARLLDLGVLDDDEAARMLVEELATVDPGDVRAASDPAAVARVVRMCGGLPLAVRVAAALLAAMPEQSVAELADALSEERRRLTELSYDSGLAVRAAFDLSYRNLDPAAARLFRLIALNPGPEIGLGAMAALLGIEESEVRPLLRELRRANLVQPAAGPDRWRLHDLLRLYAGERAGEDPEREDAFARLLDYYLDTVREARDHIRRTPERAARARFTGPRQAIQWGDTEHASLVGMVTSAARHGHPRQAVELTRELYQFFEVRELRDEWYETHVFALAITRESGDASNEARMLNHLGVLFRKLGRLDDAESCHRRALTICREIGSSWEEGHSLTRLGDVLQIAGNPSEALNLHQRALAIYRQLGDRAHEGGALFGIAVACRLLGRLEESLRCRLEDLRIVRSIGARLVEGRNLNGIGIVYREMGRLEEAVACHLESLTVLTEVGDRHRVARARADLGLAYREMGRFDEAVECLLDALRFFGEVADRRSEGHVLTRLADTCQRMGRVEEAERYHRRAADAFAVANDLESVRGDRLTGV